MPSPTVRSSSSPQSSSPKVSSITTGNKRKSTTEKESQYSEKRCKDIETLKEAGINPYPYGFDSGSIMDVIESYRGEGGVNNVSVAGRVMSLRGKFFDMSMDGSKLSTQKEVVEVHKNLRRGDIVGVSGHLAFTNTKVLTLYASELVSLCPCLHQLPGLKGGKKSNEEKKNDDVSKTDTWTAGKTRNLTKYLLNQESRYHKRYLDMMLNEEVIRVMQARSRIISYIRLFLNEKGFVEVETPILNKVPSGGAAIPFKTLDGDNHVLPPSHIGSPIFLFGTSQNDYQYGTEGVYYLRIAPELRLKEFLIGGFSRVFEIGKQFRNEGIDSTHHPEFTSCELYVNWKDYNFLMRFTEDLLSGIVKELTGGLKIKYRGIDLDFAPPYRKIDMIAELESKANVKIPRPFSSPGTLEFLVKLCKDCNIQCGGEMRTGRLLDKLVGHYLEGLCVNPTFIINHPVIMSPMAKAHREYPDLTERFELFIDKKELCNAYTELNDPKEQRQRFAEQLELLKAGDSEAMRTDEAYCTALEYGLPPCAGWGIGIDRLAMFLTDSQNIKEVLSFT